MENFFENLTFLGVLIHTGKFFLSGVIYHYFIHPLLIWVKKQVNICIYKYISGMLDHKITLLKKAFNKKISELQSGLDDANEALDEVVLDIRRLKRSELLRKYGKSAKKTSVVSLK